MKERAIAYCEGGENCSRAILRASADCYGFLLSDEMIDSCNALSAGFGIGGICSSIVAAVMVLGILFPESEAKQKSLLFFCLVREKWGCMDCCRLSARREDCKELIGDLAEQLEKVIQG